MQKERKLKDDYIHLEDLFMKTAAQFFGDELLQYLGIHLKAVRAAPTEVVHLEARKMYEDFNYEMENGEWYHFEFESDRISMDDLRRFREYEAATSRIFAVPVVTCVVCSSDAKKLRSELKEGINTYRVKIFHLKKHSADKVFTQLQEKSMENIRKQDLLAVLLSPLMQGRMPRKERIVQGFEYLKREYETVPGEELRKMQAMLYALAEKMLTKAELEDVKEVVAMTRLGQMLVADGIEKGLEEGMEKGIQQGTERMRRLTKILLDQKRYEDLDKAAQDSDYCRELMERYKI